MHLNYYAIAILAKARQDQLLEYAQRTNVPRAVKTGKISFRERFLLQFGELLISLGSWIKHRYQPKFYTESTALRADSTNTCISS